MSADDDGKASLRREWIATLDTNLKASTAAAGTLPDSEKLGVAKGAVLTAALIDEDPGYWTIADGVLDGLAVPAPIHLVYKPHWRLLPVTDATAPVVEPAALAETKEAEVDAFLAESLLAEPVQTEPIQAEPVQAEAPEPEPEPAPAVVTPVPAPPVPAPPVAAAKPLPEKEAPKAPSDRRLFASFRRRLSKK